MERPDERTLSPEAKEYISYLENRLENMSAMYRNLQKTHFGSKSEKQKKDTLPEDCEQLSMQITPRACSGLENGEYGFSVYSMIALFSILPVSKRFRLVGKLCFMMAQMLKMLKEAV